MSEFDAANREARDTQLEQEFLAACAIGGIGAAKQLRDTYEVQLAAVNAVLDGFSQINKEVQAGDASALGLLTSWEFADFRTGFFTEYADAALDYRTVSVKILNLRMNAPHD